MACSHPPEEHLGVYQGGTHRQDDRRLCSLCGEIVYVAVAAPAAPSLDLLAVWTRPGGRRADGVLGDGGLHLAG